MAFITAMKTELNHGFTENGAAAFNSSTNALVDLNYFAASFRSMSESEILNYWITAYYENKELALRWLFYSRDIRGGMGERRTFRVIMNWLAETEPHIANQMLALIPIFGRWDDIVSLVETNIGEGVIKMIDKQMANDMKVIKFKNGESISLMAKWLPSVNASAKTKKIATIIRRGLGMSEKTYRQVLSKMRKYIDVTERKMSSNNWGDIRYEAVPSYANLRYANSFMKHDKERRSAYLCGLAKGETKINAGTLFPHDIVNRYRATIWNDPTLEELWKNLPNTVNGECGTLVVCDGSGSMECSIGNTGTRAIDVAYALSIYFSERMHGEFKDKFITFSSRPQLVDLSMARSLCDKLQILRRYNDCSNTNLEAVFDLVLRTAISQHMTQEELPKQLLIISDGEFDAMVNMASATIFHSMQRKFESYGYHLPKLVFWNVNNRSKTLPATTNDRGVILVSGFSVNTIKMVMSEQNDPLSALMDTIMDPRYDCVSERYRFISGYAFGNQ